MPTKKFSGSIAEETLQALDLQRMAFIQDQHMRQRQSEAAYQAARFGQQNSLQGLQSALGGLGQSLHNNPQHFVTNTNGIKFHPHNDAVRIRNDVVTRKQILEGRELTFVEKLQHDTDKWLRKV